MNETNYVIRSNFDKLRINDFLEYYHVGNNKIKKLKFMVNNKEASLSSILFKDDILTIIDDEEIDFIGENKSLDIVYEDEYLLIINKPAHILVHPDDKSKGGSICNMVASYYKKNNINHSIKYLHRIDIDTTGLLMFAKDLVTSSIMNYKISLHEVKREYLAIVSGVISEEGVIDKPIGEDRHHNQRRRVSMTGQSAITFYKPIKRLAHNYTLLSLVLKTGRTHQIRVHMKYLGHPLAGDLLYGGSDKYIKRQALHSYHLEFIHPITEDVIDLYAKVPLDMQKLMEK